MKRQFDDLTEGVHYEIEVSPETTPSTKHLLYFLLSERDVDEVLEIPEQEELNALLKEKVAAGHEIQISGIPYEKTCGHTGIGVWDGGRDKWLCFNCYSMEARKRPISDAARERRDTMLRNLVLK